MIGSHAVGTAIRRDIHDKFGIYDVSYKIYADGAFILKCIKAGCTVVNVPFVADEYCTRGASNRNQFIRAFQSSSSANIGKWLSVCSAYLAILAHPKMAKGDCIMGKSKPLKVLCLPRYSRLGASSRLRSYQYLPHLREVGLDVTAVPLLTDEYIEALYAGDKVNPIVIWKAYLSRIMMLFRKHRFDVLWIEKEAFPWLPSWFEGMVLGGSTPYLVDYDDAIYHRYDMHPNQVVRLCLSNKIDKIMRRASLVTCGNEYLAERARQAGARRVEILPTVVDLSRYPLHEQSEESLGDHVPVIGWIGSPATSHYLELVHLPLKEVCHGGKARIRLIGARDPKWTDLPYEVVSWTESQEVKLLHTLDIGIMPLPDMPWERGKCGYKLIQYMACGKPVVASPVGINRQIVVDGINGFLAESPEQWVQALVRLRDDAMLRRRMGSAGRAQVEQCYSLQVAAPRLAALLRTAATNKIGTA